MTVDLAAGTQEMPPLGDLEGRNEATRTKVVEPTDLEKAHTMARRTGQYSWSVRIQDV